MSTDPDVLILCPDLFFSSQLHGAVQRAGLVGRTCLSQKSCIEQLTGPKVRWIVADLEAASLDLPALMPALSTEQCLLAFGPHVQVERLEAARAAGAHEVWSRGQVASQLEHWLRSFLK